jgi:hypothetical protein
MFFENRVLRSILEPKRDEVSAEWRRIQNEDLYAFYSAPNIMRVMKSRTMRWAGHVARTGEGRGACRLLVKKHEGRNHLEIRGIDWRIILEWIFRLWDVGVEWIDMAHDRERWRTVVEAEMNFRVL